MTSPDEVKCLFFSEFDPIAGPKISFQVLIRELNIHLTRGLSAGDIMYWLEFV